MAFFSSTKYLVFYIGIISLALVYSSSLYADQPMRKIKANIWRATCFKPLFEEVIIKKVGLREYYILTSKFQGFIFADTLKEAKQQACLERKRKLNS